MCLGASRNKKLGVCGITSIVVGLLLITGAIVVPIVFNNVMRTEVVPSVAVTKENQDQWDFIPGPENIEVIKETYIYNWTNADEVILDGAKPEFVEIEPIPYLNTQKFLDVNYTRQQVPWEETQDERVSQISNDAERSRLPLSRRELLGRQPYYPQSLQSNCGWCKPRNPRYLA